MVAMKEMAKHPVKSAEAATDEAACMAKKVGQTTSRKARQYPWTATGIVVGAIGVAAIIYFWPELHRYIHLERM